ncbi:hypothetical protein AX16_002447 [Volvariella volvacea WC 439]|nr:hypothetical protein AX16_002447 [Volvariella volvacea WC 439]
MDACEVQVAAHILATTEAANVTEVQKKTFPDLSRFTIACRLKENGLICHVWRSKPYLSKVHCQKCRDWVLVHSTWTVKNWKQVIFSDESKFMLFKSDGHQYCWIKPGQQLDQQFTKKTVKHGGGKVMVWGCITSKEVGQLHRIDGIMDGPGYVNILQESYLGTLKDFGMKSYQWGCKGLVREEKDLLVALGTIQPRYEHH